MRKSCHRLRGHTRARYGSATKHPVPLLRFGHGVPVAIGNQVIQILSPPSRRSERTPSRLSLTVRASVTLKSDRQVSCTVGGTEHGRVNPDAPNEHQRI